MPEPKHFGPSRRPAALVCGLALSLLLALPAAASADDSVNVSLCKQILSRMLCKNLGEFNYVGRPEKDVYIIGMRTRRSRCPRRFLSGWPRTSLPTPPCTPSSIT